MENKPKKSRAFIITFILVLIILLVGYLLLKNKDGIFRINNGEKTNKEFESLTETKEAKDLGYIDVNTTNECISISAIAGEDIFKGEAVYVSEIGTNGEPIVMKAIANDETKSRVVGVAMANILTGTNGMIANNCIVTGLNTDRNEGTVWKIGDTLYLSDTIPGALTKNPPSNKIIIASVNTINAIDGSIKVGGAGTNVFDISEAIQEAGINTKQGIGYAIDKLKQLFGNIFGYEYNGGEFDPNGLGEWVWDEEYGGFIWKWKGGTGGFDGPDFPDFGSVKACNNEKDDDKDGFTDIDDPQCHINGDMTKEYIPTHYSEEINAEAICPNNAVNYPDCTINENGECINNATNPPECTNIDVIYNECKNNAVNYPECTIGTDGKCVNGYSNPPICTSVIPTPNNVCENGMTNYPICTINNNGDCGNGAINPPTCTEFENINNPDLPNENTEDMCKVFYSNPLVFTDSEQAELDRLLKKFYIMAPKLRNEDDIYSVYNKINKYIEFNEQVNELTDQCYAQKSSSTYTGPKTSYGNPWYKYSERGTYINPYSSYTSSTSQSKYEDVIAGENIKNGEQVYAVDTKDGLYIVKKYSPGIEICGGSMGICIPAIAYGTASGNINIGQIGKIFIPDFSSQSLENLNTNLGNLNCSLGGDCTGVLNESLTKDLEILLNIW